MTQSLFSLRALFPNHFSRRDDSGRGWWTLRLPNVRVVGPFWSIVLKAGQRPDGSYDLSLLSERREVQPVSVGPNWVDLHPAMALSMAPVGLWNGPETQLKQQPNDRGNSRLSLIAAASFVDAGQTELALPFVDDAGAALGSALLPGSGSILLQPLGRLPRHEATVGGHLFLTAMRLNSGRIATRARDGYMPLLRSALGLDAPSTDSDVLYFLPDGVGFRAKIKLPWQEAPLEHWMKLCARDETPELGQIALWQGPDDAPWERAVIDSFETLRQRLVGNSAAAGPAWLALETTRNFGPGNLVWPTVEAEDMLLQERPEDVAWLTGGGVQVRLSAEGAGSGADQLTLLLPLLELAKKGDELSLTAVNSLPDVPADAPEGMRAVYDFTAAQSDGEEEDDEDDTEGGAEDDNNDTAAVETLRLGAVEDGDVRAVGAAAFALPALSTAQRLAEELEIAPPRSPSLIWTHIPVAQGWAHVPFPHATTENTYDLLRNQPPKPRVSGSLTSGRLQFSPPGFDASDTQRAWSVTLTRARYIDLDVEIGAEGVASAKITFDGVAAAMAGALPVTPFRQTSERLLPSADMRVLSSFGLTAVTDNQLSDLELRLRDAGMASTLSLDDLTITASSAGQAELSPGAGAEMSVVLPNDGTDAGSAWSTLRSDMEPWVWVRHDTLPTVQSVALAEIGAAEMRPSANRELAPLILTKGENAPLRLSFSAFTDMRVGVPSLALSGRDAERPTKSAAWRDEAAMVPTTMTSVTLMPDADDQAALKSDVHSWAGLKISTELTLRADIPATDGLWTQATLPPPAPSEDDEKSVDDTRAPEDAASVGFTVQPDNGPGALATQDNSWRAAWAYRNRSLALAALERRDLVEADKDGNLVAANVLGDRTFPVRECRFDPVISFDLDGMQPEISYVGEASFEIMDAPGESAAARIPVVLRGLPDVSDLEGIKGDFRRADGASATLRLGALVSPSEGADLIDHLGLRSGDVVRDAARGILVREVARFAGNTPQPQTWRLVSLAEPVTIPGASLMLVDIPLAADSNASDLAAFWRAADGTWADGATDQAGLGQNHTAGFAWNLWDPDPAETQPEGLLNIDNWLLAPMALLRVEWTEDLAFASAVIACHLYTRVLSAHGETLLPCDGQAELTVTAGGSAEVVPKNVSIPVGDPSLADGQVPIVTSDADGSAMAFVLGDKAHRLRGTLDIKRKRKEFFWKPQSSARPANILETAEVRATFDRAPEVQEPPNATMSMTGSTHTPLSGGRGIFKVSFTVALDLIENTVTGGALSFTLYGTTITCDILPSSRFDGRRLAVDLTVPDAAQSLFGISVSAISGTFVAYADEIEEEWIGRVPRFELTMQGLVVALTLGDGDEALTLEVNTQDTAEELRLSGRLPCTNLFRWPELEFAPTEAVWRPDAGYVTSTLVAHFDRAPMPLVHGTSEPVHVAAHVTHSFGALDFQAMQTVAIYSASALKTHLAATDQDARSLVPSAPPASAPPAHFHDSLAEALPEGVGPELARAFYGIDEAQDVGAFSFCGHHWLLGQDPGGAAHPLPLPFLTVFGVPFTDPVAPPDEALPFVLPGDAGQGPGHRQGAGRAVRDTDAFSDTTPGRFTFPPRVMLSDEATTTASPEQRMRADVSLALSRLGTRSSATSLTRDGAIRHGAIPEGHMGPNPWDITASAYGSDTYATVWRVLGPSGSGQVTFGTPRSVASERAAQWRLRAFAMSDQMGSLDLLATREVETPEGASAEELMAALEQNLPAWGDWAQLVLARSAPSAPLGVLFVSQSFNGAWRQSASRLVVPRLDLGRPRTTLTRKAVLSAPQGQLRASLRRQAVGAQLSKGLKPVSVSPVVATSDTPHEDGISQAGNRLTASGQTRSARMAGQDQRVLQDNAWVVTRSQVAFRASTAEDARILCPANPPKSRAALSPARLPVTQGMPTPPPALAEEAQGFVPAFVEETTLGGRPGSWSVQRQGIEITQRTKAGRTETVIASQVPVWTKDPRPVELGRNDRPRACAYEAQHMALDWQPNVVVHGPAAEVQTDPAGLNRSPRSDWASLLTLVAPHRGLVSADWDGAIALTAQAIAPPVALGDEPRAWEVRSAHMEVDGVTLAWHRTDEVPVEPVLVVEGADAPTVLAPFRSTNATTPETAAEALRRVPPGRAVPLILLLEADGITRMVTLELVVAAAGRGLPEQPLYLRFDDPAYNDQLSGLANLTREDVADGKTADIFAADAKELRPGDFVTFAFGRRSIVQDANTELPERPRISLERRRPGEPESETLSLGDVGPEMDILELDRSSASLGVLLSRVTFARSEAEGPVLAPGDRLAAQVTLDGVTQVLRFDIVDHPTLPENTSFYGLHKLAYALSNLGLASLSVPTSGFGLAPSVIEPVDPTELLRGAVRRRAAYHWRLFGRQALTDSDIRYALQKRIRVGATWLPAALDEGWIVVGPAPQQDYDDDGGTQTIS